MTGKLGKWSLPWALAGLIAASVPARASDPFASGVIGGTTFGIMDASTFAAGPPAPPPPPVSYYGRVYAGRGPAGTRCWIEPQQVWAGFGFLVEPVRVCE
jgi:hypothetical protein